jgi:outer membrane lipoprotein-sorting protein
MTRGRARGRLVTLVAATALGGCGSLLTLVPDEKDIAPVPAALATEIVQTLKEREAKVRALRAVLDLTIWYQGKRHYVQQVAVVERPSQIRLETIGWGGLTTMVVASDGHRLAAHAPFDNTYLQGAASPGNVAAVAGIGVAPSHLVRLLLGLPPIPVGVETSAIYRREEEHAYLLGARESSYTQRLWLSDDDLTLLRGELYDWKSLRLRFRYSPQGYDLYSLLLEEPSGRVVVEVWYRSFEVNPELPDDLFRLPQPPGKVRVVDLDRGSAPPPLRLP